MAARIRSLRNGLLPMDEVSRNDLVAGDVVTVIALDAALTYSWTIMFAPVGSTATFSGDPAAISPGSFTVDKEGPYLVRLIVDAGQPTESTQFVRLRYLTVFGGLHLVSAGERRDGTGIIPVDIDTEGWANEQNYNLQTLLAFCKPYAQSGRFLQVDANASTQGYGDYPTVQEAIDYAVAQGASAGTPWVVAVHTGQFTEDVTFSPYVHVVGWPGDMGDAGETQIIGNHTVALPGAGDRVVLRNLALVTLANTTTPTVAKTGLGMLVLGDAQVVAGGVDIAQGPALDLQNGSLNMNRCFLWQQGATVGLHALRVSGGAAEVTDTVLGGPTAVLVNPTMASGVRATFYGCRMRSQGTAVDGACSALRLENCSVFSSGTNVGVRFRNLAGVPHANSVNLFISYSDVGDIIYDTTNLANTGFFPGSVIYDTVTYPAGPPGNVRATTKSKTEFYDNTVSGLVAENVQDAIDEIAGLALAPTVYPLNMPEVPADTTRYRGWAPVAAELIAIRVRMMTINTQGNYTLTITNDATANTVLSAASFDMNTLVAGVIQPLGLTLNPADLQFGTLDEWTVALTSDDPLFDGAGIYVELVFNTASGGGGVVEDLATVLLVGNITGGTDIVVTTGDEIVGQTNLVLRSTGPASNIALNPGAAGAVVVNGKLTVTGLIDPTGLLLTAAAAPVTKPTEGGLFVSDGSGGLVAGDLYYRLPAAGPVLDLTAYPYTPAMMANWSMIPPMTVANALDRIAAMIGPIP